MARHVTQLIRLFWFQKQVKLTDHLDLQFDSIDYAFGIVKKERVRYNIRNKDELKAALSWGNYHTILELESF